MKILKIVYLYNKKAEIILRDDGTVTIMYDNNILLEDLRWSTIEDDIDLLETMLRAEVEEKMNK